MHSWYQANKMQDIEYMLEYYQFYSRFFLTNFNMSTIIYIVYNIYFCYNKLTKTILEIVNYTCTKLIKNSLTKLVTGLVEF